MAEHNVVFTHLDEDECWSLAAYRKQGGWTAWEKIVREKTPQEEIIETVKKSKRSCARKRRRRRSSRP